MATKTTKAIEGPRRAPTLFDIAAGWIPLLEARIDAETDPELSDERPVCTTCGGSGDDGIPPAEVGDRGVVATGPCDTCGGSGRSASERERAIEAADVALADHSSTELEKADGYIGILGYVDAAIATRRAEAERHTTVARILERMLEQLKATAVCGITAVPGRKRVDGSRGYLLAKANGGLAPLLVADPELVPDDLCKLEGSINAGDFAVMLEATRRRRMAADWTPRARFARVVDNTAVRTKLAESCPSCNGSGEIIARSAEAMSAAALESGAVVEVTTCRTCGGSKLAAVPGARLGERGVHLEVK
jgi:hypothetical protein